MSAFDRATLTRLQQMRAKQAQPAQEPLVTPEVTPEAQSLGQDLALEAQNIAPIQPAAQPMVQTQQPATQVNTVIPAVSDAISLEQEAILEAGQAGAQAERENAAFLEGQALEQERIIKENEQKQLDRQTQLNNKLTQLDEQLKTLSSAQIDPDRLFKNKSTGQKIATGIGLFLGAFGSGSGNSAVRVIENAVNQDIALQKQELENRRQNIQDQKGVIADMMKVYGDMDTAESAARVALFQNAQNRLAVISSKYKSPQIVAQAKQGYAQLEQKKEEAKLKFIQALNNTDLSVGEETLDRSFAKDLNDWRVGGNADYQENKKIFDEAINALEKGKVSTGTVAGAGTKIPGVRTSTAELENRVRKAITGMLRASLGSQFTEKEGERIMNQTFDPFASPESNIKNMRTELSKLEQRRKSLDERGTYFEKKGTLKGFNPVEVTRLTKDGRKAVFNSKTGEFLRFE